MNGARGERAPVGARGGKPESRQGVGGRKRGGGEGERGRKGKSAGGGEGQRRVGAPREARRGCELESWPPCR